MLLTALPPAPPTPSTVIRGRNSLSSGALRLIAILLSLALFFHHLVTPRFAQLIRVLIVESPEEAAGQPVQPSFACSPIRFGCQIGIENLRRHRCPGDQKADSRGIVRTERRCRQTGKCLRSADAHLLVQNASGELANTRQLT